MQVVEVRATNGFAGVFATRAFAPGARVFAVEGELRSSPSRYSIQIGRDLHVEVGPVDPPWKYLNHSCEPNVFLSVLDRSFVALRQIRAGEELRFNYLTTEWEMASPFQCACGSPECFGSIAGFKHLDHESQMRLLPWSADHIQELFLEQESTPPA